MPVAKKAATSTVAIPLPSEGPNSLGAWKSRREASRDLIKRVKPDWDKNLDRLLAKTNVKGEVVVPKDFANVEQKKAALAFQVPAIQLEPRTLNPLAEGADDPVRVFQAVVNDYLTAPYGVHADAMIEEVLSDALCPSGIFATKIGYEPTIDGQKQVQTGQQPDPNFVPPTPAQQQPGTVLGLNTPPPPQAPMVPILANVPNVIAEHYYWERIPPERLLLPDGWHGSDYEKMPWVGWDGEMDFLPAQKAFNLPDDFSVTTSTDEDRLGTLTRTTQGSREGTKKVKYSEIWYKASLFDATVKHPDQLRYLVLVDGLDTPARHEDSPYQRKQPDGTLLGMIGFPVHVGALRYVSDQAIPPSDCQMSRHQVDELSQGRTQMIQQRKRSIPMRLADLQAIGGLEGLAKIERNEFQSVIPLENMDPQHPPIVEIARAAFPRENFTFDQIANRDIADLWAMDANQRGLSNDHGVTATEVATAQANSNVRLRRERNRFLLWFARGAGKLGALIQLFATDQSYVRIIGDNGESILKTWDKTTIAGDYLFTVKADSAVPTDAAEDLAVAIKQQNMFGNSPFVNQAGFLKHLFPKMGLDPALIVQPQPKPAEVPKVTFTFNDASLDPRNPAFPIVMELLRQGGSPVDDAAVLQAQQLASAAGAPVAKSVTHGSPTPPVPHTIGQGSGSNVEPINKHQADRTGQLSGPSIPGRVA
jgi:hypothetical protein